MRVREEKKERERKKRSVDGGMDEGMGNHRLEEQWRDDDMDGRKNNGWMRT